MGLDIYLHKTRHQGNGTEIDENVAGSIIDDANSLATAELAHDYAECARKLVVAEQGNVDRETYAKVHRECIDMLKKHFTYPEFRLNKIGYGQERSEKDGFVDVYTPVSSDEWVKQMTRIIDSHYTPSICYFRKVNFIFAYFENEGLMVDEYFAFMDKNTCLDIIEKCKLVLEDHSRAEELLPTQGGFFFGSTDYDDYYFDDVKDVMDELTEKALPIYEQNCWNEGECTEENKDEKFNLYWRFSW